MDLNDLGLPKIRERADEYYRDHTWDDIESLSEQDRDHLAFKAEVWARKAVDEGTIPERLDYLQNISRHEDWRVREAVAMALKYVNEHAFEQAEQTWYAWVTHDDNYVRRACEVGLMSVPPEHVRPALELFDHLVSDSDDYVQKSCGGFAMSIVASKDRSVGSEFLDRWSRSDDVRTRWNAAKAVGGAYGGSDHALKLAYRLSGDEEYKVRRATAAALRALFDKDPSVRERVEQWDDREEFLAKL